MRTLHTALACAAAFRQTYVASMVLAAMTLALSACGGNNTPPTAAPHNAIPQVSHIHQPPSLGGVSPALLSGWNTAQRSAEGRRRSNASLALPQSTLHAAANLAWRVPASTLADAQVLGSSSTLVLYDTAGQWGFLGELYAMASANLTGHFGQVSAEPVSSYTSGQINQYTATIYIGSTYYITTDGIPATFYQDVAASTHPVLWIGDNIWNFANSIGVSAFENKYGWDPTNSYFAGPSGSVGNVTQVTYKNEPLTRTIPAGADGGVLRPNILGGTFPAVTALAQAADTSTSPATTFPWAIRSGNLTYIGEIPFQYVSESDRLIAFEDLLFDALAPNTVTQHRAMVRLEDLSAADSSAQLMTIAKFLYQNHIPYGFNVIPLYKDPTGHYNNGVPQSIALTSSAAASFVTTIKYMLSHGGAMIDEGYTHQYPGSNVNPYDGVSGDDAEFFLAHIDSGNNVVWDGPIPGDSTTWALGLVNNSANAYKAAGLPVPTLWVTPHYFATDVDYHAIATVYPKRYERSIYFSGTLSHQSVNYGEYIGEFFPYVVHDVYGTTVLPENLGDYEPVSENNHPIRLPADIVREAQYNLAVRDGFASFFYDPSYGTTPLQQTITGIQQLGYTFVSPSTP